MTVFTMFFIEIMASRFDIFAHVDLEGADPAMDLIRRKQIPGEKASDEEAAYRDSESRDIQLLS
jgi:hypothetical protein